jgi:hypothetical protein
LLQQRRCGLRPQHLKLPMAVQRLQHRIEEPNAGVDGQG